MSLFAKRVNIYYAMQRELYGTITHIIPGKIEIRNVSACRTTSQYKT